MEIIVYASEVRDLDEMIDKKLDVSEEFGTGLFDMETNRISLENYNYGLEPFTYISIIADMQEQINEMRAIITDDEVQGVLQAQLNEQHDKINDLNSRLYNLEKSNAKP